MKRFLIACFSILTIMLLTGCKRENDNGVVVTPWGEVKQAEIPTSDAFSLDDIIRGGELIMLTMSSPTTYYDYHGRGMGLHYLLCENFARQIGVSMRVELCQDTLEMVRKLTSGVGDVIAFPLTADMSASSILEGDSATVDGELVDSLLSCGYRSDSLKTSTSQQPPTTWHVSARNKELARALDAWYKSDLLAEVKKEETSMLSAPKVKRRVFSPFLNRSGGVISNYDNLFKKYAPLARWDWRLMAAQCYQESCFDPRAVSWAGARGLMQLMPKTAEHLGLKGDEVWETEANVKAAEQLIAELSASCSDIPNKNESQYFVLAAYNGGSGHVRDAMALCQKMGGNNKSWTDVSRYLLLLREPQYYSDPVVKYGYIRSTETYEYVEKIRERYAQYRGVPLGKGSGSPSAMPRRATKKHKYHL